LKPGYRADVTVFDPADFKERATYTNPHQAPRVSPTTVLVNGILVVENAVHTGALPGRVLRRDATGAVF
jgi:N-acyl-D-amino-acid deacylase